MRVWAALATIYLAWGSTFLAITVAVRTLPPFLAMSLRHLVAGGLLLGWARLRSGRQRFGRRQVAAATVFGGALFVGGHGVLAWAQERGIPSGVAALVIASIPLWVAVLDRVVLGRRLSIRAVTGLVVGFAGVALLADPTGGGSIDRLGVLAALGAAGSWAAGSLYSRGAPLPASPVSSAGLASLVGGVLLLVGSAARGEIGGLDLAQVSAESLAGVGYLIVVGSLIGLSSYVWLLRTAAISLVSTYAYANPVIAVLLGWALLGETLDGRVLLAGGGIVAAVALIVSAPMPDRALGRGIVRRREPADGEETGSFSPTGERERPEGQRGRESPVAPDWDEVEGAAKEGAGKVSGDEGLEGEGKVQGAWGDVKDKAGDVADDAKARAGDAVEEARDRT